MNQNSIFEMLKSRAVKAQKSNVKMTKEEIKEKIRNSEFFKRLKEMKSLQDAKTNEKKSE